MEISTGKPCAEVERRIRDYYIAKYPVFAELVKLQRDSNPVLAANKADSLYKVCPVSDVMNSYAPDGLYLAFVEKTEASSSEINILSLNLYAEKDGKCRVGVCVDRRKKLAGEPAAQGAPMSEPELRELLK